MKKVIYLLAVAVMAITLLSGCVFRSTGTSSSPSVSGVTPPSDSASPSMSPDPTDTLSPSPSSEPTPSAQPSPFEPVVTVETDSYAYTSDYINVSVETPRLVGVEDPTVQDTINAVFAGIYDDAVEMTSSMETQSKDDFEAGFAVGPYALDVKYVVHYLSGDVLSVTISQYTYLGGAHGGTSIYPFNYNIATGNQLSISELFVGGSDYMNVIDTNIAAEIVNRDLYELAPFSTVGSAAQYYLTLDSVVFFFQEYEYFPYAAGIQEFAIQYPAFSGMLAPDYASLLITPVVFMPGSDNMLGGGEYGMVSVRGNSSTGYVWHYTMSADGIVEPGAMVFTSDSPDPMAGADGTYSFDFRGIGPGTVTLTFEKYEKWEDASSGTPIETLTFDITVS